MVPGGAWEAQRGKGSGTSGAGSFGKAERELRQKERRRPDGSLLRKARVVRTQCYARRSARLRAGRFIEGRLSEGRLRAGRLRAGRFIEGRFAVMLVGLALSSELTAFTFLVVLRVLIRLFFSIDMAG